MSHIFLIIKYKKAHGKDKCYYHSAKTSLKLTGAIYSTHCHETFWQRIKIKACSLSLLDLPSINVVGPVCSWALPSQQVLLNPVSRKPSMSIFLNLCYSVQCGSLAVDKTDACSVEGNTFFHIPLNYTHVDASQYESSMNLQSFLCL